MICWRSVSCDRRNRMRRLANASTNTGGARSVLTVDTASIQVSSGSGGTKGFRGPPGPAIGPGAVADPRAPAETPKIPTTTTQRQRGLSRWPVGKTSGRKQTRIPIAGMNHAEATHAAGTISGQSPPAAIADRSYSPPAKQRPASTPDTRRSQPITFSERLVVRIAPTRPRFAGRSRKMRRNGMSGRSPLSRAAAIPIASGTSAMTTIDDITIVATRARRERGSGARERPDVAITAASSRNRCSPGYCRTRSFRECYDGIASPMNGLGMRGAIP